MWNPLQNISGCHKETIKPGTTSKFASWNSLHKLIFYPCQRSSELIAYLLSPLEVSIILFVCHRNISYVGDALYYGNENIRSEFHFSHSRDLLITKNL